MTRRKSATIPNVGQEMAASRADDRHAPNPVYESLFASAVHDWWDIQRASKKPTPEELEASRLVAEQEGLPPAQAIKGIRAGKSMDGFRKTITDELVRRAGVKREDIYPHLDDEGNAVQGVEAATELPSYFRASKKWDLLVCKNSLYKRGATSRDEPRLIAAIEFKSQFASIGNNQNNRVEEAVGSAADFWASQEKANLGCLAPRPWLGYLFIGMYESEHLDKPVRVHQPHFHADPAFVCGPEKRQGKTRVIGWSYARRYHIMMDRLLGRQLYDRACLLTTYDGISRDKLPYVCPFADYSGTSFVDGLVRHVAAYYPDEAPSGEHN